MPERMWQKTVRAVQHIASKCQLQYGAADVRIKNWREDRDIEQDGRIIDRRIGPSDLLEKSEGKDTKPLELIVISLDINHNIFRHAFTLLMTDRQLYTHFVYVREGKFSKTDGFWECDIEKLELMLHTILKPAERRHQRYEYPL